jgi:hypothetical protein
MGTTLSRPSRSGPDAQQGNNASVGGAQSEDFVMPGSAGDTGLRAAGEAFRRILDLLGPGRIEQATVTQTLVLHPCSLDQGEEIAHELGLHSALDHRQSTPGCTIWSGMYLGVEVQVRASLRRLVASEL